MNNTLKTLVYLRADYTAVDAALATIPEDMSNYTDESVKAVNDAKEAVVRNRPITKQSEVDAMAKAINDAVAGLTYKAAQHSFSMHRIVVHQFIDICSCFQDFLFLIEVISAAPWVGAFFHCIQYDLKLGVI